MSKPYWKIFLERFVISAILVFATYNIFGFSYSQWVLGTPFEGLSNVVGVLKILLGILLLVAYGFLLRATWRATGAIGILSILAVCVAFVWLLQVAGWINLAKPSTTILVVEIVLCFILTLGSTWSILWKQSTGQVQVEDADTPEGQH
jgi:hypothetical protein